MKTIRVKLVFLPITLFLGVLGAIYFSGSSSQIRLSNSQIPASGAEKLYLTFKTSEKCYVTNLAGSSLKRGQDLNDIRASRCIKGSDGTWLIQNKKKPSFYLAPIRNLTQKQILKAFDFQSKYFSTSLVEVYINRFFSGGFLKFEFPKNKWSKYKWKKKKRHTFLIGNTEVKYCLDTLGRPQANCPTPITQTKAPKLFLETIEKIQLEDHPLVSLKYSGTLLDIPTTVYSVAPNKLKKLIEIDQKYGTKLK